MKKLFCTIATLSLMLGISSSAVAQKSAPPKVGDTAPDFTVAMFDTPAITLSKLRGKVVLINFWATWCPPCKSELKRVENDIIKRFEGKDFVFIPISGGETKETVDAFRKANNYTFPMGLDMGQMVSKLYGASSIPRNFILDRSGKIVKIELGYDAKSFDIMVAQIDELLKTKK